MIAYGQDLGEIREYLTSSRTGDVFYIDIPEEYVLFGKDINVFAELESSSSIIEPRLLEFADTDGNGIVDQVRWSNPSSQASGDSSGQDYVFYIDAGESNFTDAEKQLEKMQDRFDVGFYKKTLGMLNAKASGSLQTHLDSVRGESGGFFIPI